MYAQKNKKTRLNVSFLHHIVQYYICNILIPYTFAVETNKASLE